VLESHSSIMRILSIDHIFVRSYSFSTIIYLIRVLFETQNLLNQSMLFKLKSINCLKIAAHSLINITITILTRWEYCYIFKDIKVSNKISCTITYFKRIIITRPGCVVNVYFSCRTCVDNFLMNNVISFIINCNCSIPTDQSNKLLSQFHQLLLIRDDKLVRVALDQEE